MGLVDHARARSERLRERLSQKLEALRSKCLSTRNRLGRHELNDLEKMVTYYGSWLPSAIHVLLTSPKYRTARAVAMRLNVGTNEVEKSLRALNKLGLVRRKGAEWHTSEVDLNLPETSQLSIVNHMNWRHKAVESLQVRRSDSIHYSSVFTLNAIDADKVKKELNSMLSSVRGTIVAAPSEELFSLNLDFFLV
jgi:hypothetical protein